jgi:hypothetical protein
MATAILTYMCWGGGLGFGGPGRSPTLPPLRAGPAPAATADGNTSRRYGTATASSPTTSLTASAAHLDLVAHGGFRPGPRALSATRLSLRVCAAAGALPAPRPGGPRGDGGSSGVGGRFAAAGARRGSWRWEPEGRRH